MRHSFKLLQAALLLLVISLSPQAYAQTARVQVVHNSPYAEAASVDVYINDALAIDDFAFQAATPFLDLEAGVAVKIDVTGADAADNSSPVFSTTIDAGLPADGTLVIVAAGDPLNRDGNPAFGLFIAEAREAAATAGNVELLVFHGSPDAPTVDVAARGVGVLVDDFSFGEFAPEYLSVAPANYDLDVQTADNSTTAASFNADLSAAADAAISVLASGFLAPPSDTDPGFGLLAVFADGMTAMLPAIDPPPAPMARVQVIHNSPYAEAAVVDVYLNDALTLDDVAFRDATPFLDVPAGVPVKIDVTGSDAADNTAPVFTTELADGIPEGATLIGIAAGDPLNRDGNPAFDIFITEAREAASTTGNAEILVFHGSPDAPTVDVAARGVGVLVDDISFGEYSDDYLSVPPAEYDIDVQTADNSATAASFGADLSGAADAAIAVVASGFLVPATDADPGFGLLAVFADGTTALLPAIEPPPPAMARAQVVHNSPYAEAAVVDVYLNDELTLDDFAFRDATPFLDLPAGVAIKVDVTAADAADNSAPVFTAELADGIPAGATVLVVAAGDPLGRDGNPAFNVFIAEARESAATAGNAEFLVFHGSPDAPTVDVAVRGVGVVVDDISFGEYAADYLSVPPAAYEVDIETADNSVTAASYAADLSGAADVAISVLASGFLAPASDGDPAFGLLAVFPDGTTALLPALEDGVTFSLIDADSDAPIAAFDPMPQGAVLDLSTLPAVNIRANISEAASVRFDLNDDTGVRVEHVAPFALCGDLQGDYLTCHLPQGDHVVTATAFSGANASGEAGESGSIAFTVVNSSNSLASFVLVDAESDEDIMALEDGMMLDLNSLPAHLNVRAEAGDKVKSVAFEISPTDYSRVENVVPFALYGDLSSDYLGGSFAEGEITISATPYTMTRTEGDAGETLSITLQVTGSSSGKSSVMRGHSEEPVLNETIALNGELGEDLPASFKLDGNYPNPFNPSTTIAFSLPEASEVRISVYDMLGRQVRVLVDGQLAAGRNEVVFDAAGLPTGTYLYRVTTPTQSLTRKMLLVK